METKQFVTTMDAILTRIEKARLGVSGHHIVKIVAASKSATPQMIEAMYNIGQRCFGENKIQDMSEKVHALAHLPLEWHFIGRLQTNKINQLIDLDPFLMHSLSSLELAQELDKRLHVKNKQMNALLQINSAYEEQKAGVLPEEALEIYEQISLTCKNIQLKGVMSIGAHSEDTQLIQKSFETTHTLFESLQSKGAKYCSMGMSNDFELAIACGANMIRLGSILFK
ncbi:YggS family pyridoxal phosphate-dependent enzyme [Sulfurospirillum barnesii]|uniref:Pyridoxal phosphate homeostasis protein n=1 Tax=Sulfurospirillum barnesii (strain ATCC 700032 / DSM 10660 / SES-3) TaxID=760154 RepID=I3XX22_SULBS|nr:YggS family pyridoxal phosphate-dependent enzyme [Sulfurospirillum barnesii]AFL68496.1 pyridoxal phosphate enzyme, YggS family [Sulfurospirillum barnesii SES-3]